jgi:hypothetical protein
LTKEQCLQKIEKETGLEIIRSSRIPYFRKKISFRETGRAPWFTIQIAGQLPGEIVYPEKERQVVADASGLTINGIVMKWNEVLVTGIKRYDSGGDDPAKYKFLAALDDGRLICTDYLEMGFLERYTVGEFGHLVELYKCKYRLEHGLPPDPDAIIR